MIDSASLRALLQPDPALRIVPVRHNSPRCAHHLRELLRDFSPEHILIEGPEELNALLPALQHPQARPPLAGYLHAPVSDGAGNDLRCRCYVPFAAFSPEWVALREGQRLKARVQFIDLAYGQQLAREHRVDYYARDPEPVLGARDASSTIVKQLVHASGSRNFHEWWDRHFESGITPADAGDYFESLLAFSLLLRGEDGDDPLNRLREDCMGAAARAALASGQRCLLVCGGYHVPGIVARLGQPPAPLPAGPLPTVSGHLIPYDLPRLERAGGYAAGVPSPAYYQAVWQLWDKGEARPYQAAWPALAARFASQLREAGQPATLPDAREAVAMAHRLAALRGCAGGRAELREALRSTLRKDGDDNSFFKRQLRRFFSGDDSGSLPPNAPVSPLVSDTEAFCRQYRLPLRGQSSARRELDIYRNPRHRLISRGLHRLRYLGVPYARRVAGPDFVQGEDLGRVREIWELGWQLETTTQLTEASRYGASLEEAAANRLLEQLAQPGAGNPCEQVLQVLVMGLDALALRVLQAVAHWLSSSYDALALAQGTGRLATAFEARNALGGVGLEHLESLLNHSFAQACLRLPWLAEGDEAQARAAVDALADLQGMVRRAAPWSQAKPFHEACVLLHQAQAPAAVRGAAAGVLTSAGHWNADEVDHALAQALGQAHVAPRDMGEFLQGFLRIAHGWLLTHPPTLQGLSARIAACSEDAFLDGLPALRLAFTELTRNELRALATLLSGQEAPERLLASRVPDTDTLRRSQALAGAVTQLMQHWGFHD